VKNGHRGTPVAEEKSDVQLLLVQQKADAKEIEMTKVRKYGSPRRPFKIHSSPLNSIEKF